MKMKIIILVFALCTMIHFGQCNCENGYFEDDGSCEPCHYKCLTCNGPSEENCLTCDENTVLSDNKCENLVYQSIVGRYSKVVDKNTEIVAHFHIVEIEQEGEFFRYQIPGGISCVLYPFENNGKYGPLMIGTDCPYYSQGETQIEVEYDNNGNVVKITGPFDEDFERINYAQIDESILGKYEYIDYMNEEVWYRDYSSQYEIITNGEKIIVSDRNRFHYYLTATEDPNVYTCSANPPGFNEIVFERDEDNNVIDFYGWNYDVEQFEKFPEEYQYYKPWFKMDKWSDTLELHYNFVDQSLQWHEQECHFEDDYIVQDKEFCATGKAIDLAEKDLEMNRDGIIYDISEHEIDTNKGLLLGGENVFGENEPQQLAFIEFPNVAGNQYLSEMSVVFIVRYEELPQQSNTLIHMGSGWHSHFTLSHYQPTNKLMLQVTPGWCSYLETEQAQSGQCGWFDRTQIYSETTIETGITYHITAVFTNEGRIRLYVNGNLEAESVGLDLGKSMTDKYWSLGLPFASRTNNYIGRWMRPDQSTPLNCGIFDVKIYSEALSCEAVINDFNEQICIKDGQQILCEKECEIYLEGCTVCDCNGCTEVCDHDLTQQEWVKVFAQQDESLGGGYFEAGEFSKNIYDPSAKLYSVLGETELFEYLRNDDGLFVFKIVWPGLSEQYEEFDQEYMIWSQRSQPSEEEVIDYTPIDVPYPGPGNKDFLGLELSTDSRAIMDGNAGIWNWHYAIGTTTIWVDGIPGPIAYGTEACVHNVELYVKNPIYVEQSESEPECPCVIKEGLEPWAEFCNVGCTDKDYCIAHHYYCDWISVEDPHKCDCEVKEGKEAYADFCMSGCEDEDYCVAHQIWCTWQNNSGIDNSDESLVLHYEFENKNIDWQEQQCIVKDDYLHFDKTLCKTATISDLSNYERDGAIFDLYQHTIEEEGLLLGNTEYVFGENQPQQLAFIEFPAIELSGVAMSVAFTLRYDTLPEQDNTLIYMGDGWSNHFSIKHYRPSNKILFQVTPSQEQGGWGQRTGILSNENIEAGIDYHVVAVLAENGHLYLYVNGRMTVEGDSQEGMNVSGLNGISRQQNYIGRWMRPDQSSPLNAGLYSIKIYDEELTSENVQRLYQQIGETSTESEYEISSGYIMKTAILAFAILMISTI